jgi:phosphopantetheine binding protein
MGLALVEIIIDVEQRFGIEIPDPVAVQLRTPRALIDHVCSLVQAVDDEKCVSQQAFYVTRRALMEAANVPKAAVHPATPVESVLSEPLRTALWPKVARKLGVRIRLRRPAWVTWAIAVAAAATAVATAAATTGHSLIAGSLAAATVGTIGLVATRHVAVRLPETVGAVARAAIPALVAKNGAERGHRWTRSEVAETIRQVIRQQEGIGNFSDDADFVRDLGLG